MNTQSHKMNLEPQNCRANQLYHIMCITCRLLLCHHWITYTAFTKLFAIDDRVPSAAALAIIWPEYCNDPPILIVSGYTCTRWPTYSCQTSFVNCPVSDNDISNTIYYSTVMIPVNMNGRRAKHDKTKVTRQFISNEEGGNRFYPIPSCVRLSIWQNKCIYRWTWNKQMFRYDLYCFNVATYTTFLKFNAKDLLVTSLGKIHCCHDNSILLDCVQLWPKQSCVPVKSIEIISHKKRLRTKIRNERMGTSQIWQLFTSGPILVQIDTSPMLLRASKEDLTSSDDYHVTPCTSSASNNNSVLHRRACNQLIHRHSHILAESHHIRLPFHEWYYQ